MEYWLSVLYISLEFYAYTLGMEAFLPRRWKKSKHWLFFFCLDCCDVRLFLPFSFCSW
jgi:hypothetical protein